MINDYTFIDFDGVILDSEERMLERKYNLGLHDHKNESEFDTYFEYTNLHPEEWKYILKEAKSINNSVEIIKELENLKRKIAILTKIHTLQEMKIKTEVLRNDFKDYKEINFNGEVEEFGYTVEYISPPISKFLVVKSNNKEYVFTNTTYDNYVEINAINK